MPDKWEQKGVKYTIEPAKGSGAIITAQRKSKVMIHSRIVARFMTREEVEQLFEANLRKAF